MPLSPNYKEKHCLHFPSTPACCIGTSSIGSSISSSSASADWIVLPCTGSDVVTGTSGALIGVTGLSGAVIGVVAPVVTGVGDIPVTCLLLVLCLLPVKALKTLTKMPWLLSTCSFLT